MCHFSSIILFLEVPRWSMFILLFSTYKYTLYHTVYHTEVSIIAPSLSLSSLLVSEDHYVGDWQVHCNDLIIQVKYALRMPCRQYMQLFDKGGQCILNYLHPLHSSTDHMALYLARAYLVLRGARLAQYGFLGYLHNEITALHVTTCRTGAERNHCCYTEYYF